MPVAGMAYLDRPTPGGYFIFPDLSVRHEGKFRLSFNLFEELKEDKDADADPSPTAADVKPLPGAGMAPESFAIWRLEVKSVPFNVFSAKKFPGLAESTNLSRVVAEQGCRVRIRRDVRMRRRDNKSKDFDEYDDTGYARTDRFATPLQQVPERPRSISNGSMHGSVHGSVHGGAEPATPYSVEHRRSSESLSYYSQPSYAAPPPQPQPNQAAPYTSHLAFGSNSAQYAAPSFQPPAPLVAQQPQRFVQPTNDYQYHSSAHSRPVSTPQNYAYPPSQPQQPTYQQLPIYSNSSPEYQPVPDYRRASLPSSQQGYASQSMTSYSQQDNRQTSMQPNYYPSSMQQNLAPRSATPGGTGQVLPPIQTLQPPIESKYESKYEPYTPTTLPAPVNNITPSSSYENLHNKYQPYTSTPISGSATDYGRMSKRSHEQVFDNSHQYQALHSGMRPSAFSAGREVPQIEAEDGSLVEEYDLTAMRMLSYRRADGTTHLKKCPSPIRD